MNADNERVFVFVTTAMEQAYVVALFDIDRYIYVFFRELALESTSLCDKTYYSRVARVCKVINVSYCSLTWLLLVNVNSR